MGEKCDSEVFEKGNSVAVLDAKSVDAERWVQAVALVSGQRVDWHYSGGRANVLYLGDHAKVLAAVEYLAPCLKGTVLGVYDMADAHGPYRAGDLVPDGVVAVEPEMQVRLDGLYRVTTAAYCAGFRVEAGHVTSAAPILRKRVLPRWDELLQGAVAIVGCRPPKDGTPEAWATFQTILRAVARLVEALPDGTTVVSGGARGVDTAARELSLRRGFMVVECLPDVVRYDPKQAPLVRNNAIVGMCSTMHSFPAMWSRGSYHVAGLAQQARKLAKVHQGW